VDSRDDLAGRGRVRHGRVGAHPAGIRPRVAVADPLEVPGDRQRQGVATVADREGRDLAAFEELLDQEPPAVRRRGPQRCVQLRPRAADEDAFPGCEPVRLDDARQARHRHRLGRRHARGAHHLLGEALRALDARGGGARPEDEETRVPECVADAGHERRLRPDHDEIDGQAAGEREQSLSVLGPDGMAGAEPGDARIARCRVQAREGRALRELPGERVLATPRADHQNPHRQTLTRV
jgi:hypothetical protein